jgi:hypothetical protein
MQAGTFWNGRHFITFLLFLYLDLHRPELFGMVERQFGTCVHSRGDTWVRNNSLWLMLIIHCWQIAQKQICYLLQIIILIVNHDAFSAFYNLRIRRKIIVYTSEIHWNMQFWDEKNNNSRGRGLCSLPRPFSTPCRLHTFSVSPLSAPQVPRSPIRPPRLDLWIRPCIHHCMVAVQNSD